MIERLRNKIKRARVYFYNNWDEPGKAHIDEIEDDVELLIQENERLKNELSNEKR